MTTLGQALTEATRKIEELIDDNRKLKNEVIIRGKEIDRQADTITDLRRTNDYLSSSARMRSLELAVGSVLPADVPSAAQIYLDFLIGKTEAGTDKDSDG